MALTVNTFSDGGQSIIMYSYKSLIVSNIFFKIYSLFSTPIKSISAPERLTFDGITFKLSTALSVKHSENVHSPIKSS